MFKVEDCKGTFYINLLSSPLVVSFSGSKNRVTTEGNETTGGGLKQLEEIGNFLPLVSLSKM